MKSYKIIKDTATNEEYVLVKGTILTKEEAIRDDIIFGYIDIAPVPQKGNTEPIQAFKQDVMINYLNHPYIITENTVELEEEHVLEDYIPDELLDKALGQAMDQQMQVSIHGASVVIKKQPSELSEDNNKEE